MRQYPNPFRRLAGVAALGLGLALAANLPASAQATITLDAPASATSIGGADGEALDLAIQRAGVEPKFIDKFQPKDLGDTKTLFIAVGAAPGADIAAEIARGNALIDAAKKGGVYVVLVHIGGKARRDPATDQVIKAIGPKSNLLMILADSDADGLFKGIASAGGIPIREARSAVFLPELIKGGFGSGS